MNVRLGALALAWGLVCAADVPRTGFQSFAPYSPKWAPPAQLAMVYGVDEGVVSRAQSWREAGYRIGIMTGVAWGHYQDWYEGRHDGKTHREDIQHDREGNELSHGGSVYYMVPSEGYVDYLAGRIEETVRAAGPEYLVMEEPEFWARAGYSETFRKEWFRRYGEPWEPPHSSPSARWKAARLMYELYRRALEATLSAGKRSAAVEGRRIKCLVATHSLINYTLWSIVSPESSLMSLPQCDGVVAQVWTGTARTPIKYEGRVAERSFENAFLEYGIMANMARIPGKEVWFLHDPVEDDPNHDWEDYRRNWEETVAASLLWPEVNRYEVMPWPDRIYDRRYKAGPLTDEKVLIPPGYRRELERVIAALGRMPHASSGCCRWLTPDPGIGVVLSDTAMWMRGEPPGSSMRLDGFYGLALPLVKHGVAVRPVQAEFVHRPGFLDPYRVILLSYDFQMPPSPQFHEALAAWVRGGGALVYVGRRSHPFFGVPEWWNEGGKGAGTPLDALRSALGIEGEEDGVFQVGKGTAEMIYEPAAAWAESPEGARRCLEVVRKALARAAPEVEWRQANHMLVQRGPFLAGRVLEESGSDEPLRIGGRWINLFSDSEEVLVDPVFRPGESILLEKAAETTPPVE